jgi:hypothetical protein
MPLIRDSPQDTQHCATRTPFCVKEMVLYLYEIKPKCPLTPAAQTELGGSVSIECSPMLLIFKRSIRTNGGLLSRLVKGFEVEDIHPPVEHTADAGLPEGVCIRCTGRRCFVIGTTIYTQ